MPSATAIPLRGHTFPATVPPPTTAWKGLETNYIMQEHLKPDRADTKTLSQRNSKEARHAGLSHDFIQLLVYLHFGKPPYAAERLSEPHRKNQIMLQSSITTPKAPSDMLACRVVLLAFNIARIRAI